MHKIKIPTLRSRFSESFLTAVETRSSFCCKKQSQLRDQMRKFGEEKK